MVANSKEEHVGSVRYFVGTARDSASHPYGELEQELQQPLGKLQQTAINVRT